jgi:hypothetical protein
MTLGIYNTLAPLPPRTQQWANVIRWLSDFEAEIQGNARSHVYQVRDQNRPTSSITLKTPSPNIADDIDALRAFQREDWIGQRFHHPDIVKTCTPLVGHAIIYI